MEDKVLSAVKNKARLEYIKFQDKNLASYGFERLDRG